MIKDLEFRERAAMSALIAFKTVNITPNINSTNIPNVIRDHFIMNYPPTEIHVFTDP